jgi:hypothetical protein
MAAAVVMASLNICSHSLEMEILSIVVFWIRRCPAILLSLDEFLSLEG